MHVHVLNSTFNNNASSLKVVFTNYSFFLQVLDSSLEDLTKLRGAKIMEIQAHSIRVVASSAFLVEFVAKVENS